MINSSTRLKNGSRGYCCCQQISEGSRQEPIIAKISQEVLAEMIAREPLHEQVRELGFIDYNGHLEVHNSLLSVVLNKPGAPWSPTA